MQGARDVPFPILTGHDDLSLLARQHPIRTNLGIQVPIDLVGPDRDLVALELLDDSLDPIQLSNRVFFAFLQGHKTMGSGRPFRAPIMARARPMVDRLTLTPVFLCKVTINISIVQVGRGQP